MKEMISIMADLATIATLIVTLFTLDKVKKIENRTRVSVDQSSGKDSASRTDVKQQIKGDRNIQTGRDAHA